VDDVGSGCNDEARISAKALACLNRIAPDSPRRGDAI